MQGKRYDAAWRTKADGRGTWWDGLDPQELYNGPIMKLPDGYRDRTEVDGWHERTTGSGTRASRWAVPIWLRNGRAVAGR